MLATASGAYSATGPGFCDAVLSGRLDQANCQTLAQSINPALAGTGAQSDDGRVVLSQPGNRLDNEEFSTALNLSADLGGLTLTSITGFTEFDFGFAFDYDASQLNLGGWAEQAKLRNFTQEVRLASPSSGAFRWQVGAIYSNYRFNEFKEFNWTDNPLLFDTFNPIFGVDFQDLFLDVTYNQKTRYWGVYGQFDYDLSPDLTLSGSVRYSDERTTYRDGRTGFRKVTSFPAPGGIDLIAVGDIDRDYRLGDHWTGSATLSYRPNSDALVYAAISRGYKSGGVPGGFPQTPEDTLPYQEEFVLNFEGGFKTEWLDRKLQINGSMFYYDHDDIQAFTTLPSTLTPGQFAFRLTNIGSGYNFGAELDVVLRPMTGLRLSASVGYLKTKITDSDNVFFSFDNQPIPWKGQRLEFAPSWSGNLAGSYTTPVGNGMSLTASADYNFRTANRIGQTPVDQALRGIPGYGVANGRIMLETDSRISLSVWSKNLFNKAYITDAGNDGVGSFYRTYGEPRAVGVSAGYKW